VPVEGDERSGRPSTSKTTENVEKFENSSTKIVAEQSMSSQTPLGVTYGVCLEILIEKLSMRRIAPSQQRACPHVPDNHKVYD
jgi:hypothetical protein